MRCVTPEILDKKGSQCLGFQKCSAGGWHESISMLITTPQLRLPRALSQSVFASSERSMFCRLLRLCPCPVVVVGCCATRTCQVFSTCPRNEVPHCFDGPAMAKPITQENGRLQFWRSWSCLQNCVYEPVRLVGAQGAEILPGRVVFVGPSANWHRGQQRECPNTRKLTCIERAHSCFSDVWH